MLCSALLALAIAPAFPCSCRRPPLLGYSSELGGRRALAVTLSLPGTSQLLAPCVSLLEGQGVFVFHLHSRPPYPAPLAHFGSVAVSRGLSGPSLRLVHYLRLDDFARRYALC